MIDSETATRITMDIARGTEPEGYDAEMMAYYKEAKADWEAWERDHPGAILDIPAELPDADIPVQPAPKPKKGAKRGRD